MKFDPNGKFFKIPNFKLLDTEFKNDVILQIPKLVIETLVVSTISFIIIFMIFKGTAISEILPIITVYGAVGIRLMPSITRIIASLQRLKSFLPSLIIVSDEYKSDLFKNNKNYKENMDNNFIFSHLKFKNVSFRFNDKNLILENINLEIKKGEIVGIYGNSGSGKSTFANLISGLIYPT